MNQIYDSELTIDHIRDSWNIVRRTCKNKRAVHQFSLNANTNIYQIYKQLKNRTYKPFPFRIFLIFEPKARLVMSQHISDKIVNHFITNYYLLPFLEKKLIDTNVATRKGKGSSYAVSLLEKYLNEIRMKEKGKEIYILKLDISKYFYTIDHEILIDKLRRDKVDEEVLSLIRKVIDETNAPYVNMKVKCYNDSFHTDIPYYKKGVGLSIGAMSSQFFAIYYLSEVDHFIKEQLRCKYYIRYMDDFLILDTNKSKLKSI